MSGLDPMFLQFGALGVLLVVLFFVGQIAKLFVTNAMENQKLLINGTLDKMKEISTEVGDNTKATTELTQAVLALNQNIVANGKDVSSEHKAIIEGIRRIGGFRPSTDDMPAQRGGTYRKSTPEGR